MLELRLSSPQAHTALYLLVKDKKKEASRLNTPKLLQLISANFLWWKDVTSDKREWNAALLF